MHYNFVYRLKDGYTLQPSNWSSTAILDFIIVSIHCHINFIQKIIKISFEKYDKTKYVIKLITENKKKYIKIILELVMV